MPLNALPHALRHCLECSPLGAWNSESPPQVCACKLRAQRRGAKRGIKRAEKEVSKEVSKKVSEDESEGASKEER
jgi:hypothetical protein